MFSKQTTEHSGSLSHRVYVFFHFIASYNRQRARFCCNRFIQGYTLPLFFYKSLGKKIARFFFATGLARFMTGQNRGTTGATGGEWLSQSHAMFATKQGRFVVFQQLPGYETADRVKQIGYNRKTQ